MRFRSKTVAKHSRPLHFHRARDAFSYLRVHSDLNAKEFSGVMAKLMGGFAPSEIGEALADCLDDLTGAYGTQLLTLIDQLHHPPLLHALREWLIARSDLSVEHRLPIILVLHRGGQDVNEIISPEDAEAIAARQETAIQDMLDALATSPNEMPSFLESLSAAEPERRAEIIDELSRFSDRPATVDVAKYLALSYDPVFAAGALGLLGKIDSQATRSAIQQVAQTHALPVLRMRARQMLRAAVEMPPAPELLDGHVTMIDGHGSGGIVLVARHRKKYVVTWFLCNAKTGVKDLVGHVDLAARDRDTVLRETLALAQGLDALSGAPELAGQLLADALTRCGPHTSLELPYWLDQTIGISLLPASFEPDFEAWRLMPVPAGDGYRHGVREMLSRVRCWFEDADLVYDRAEGLLKRAVTPESLEPDAPAKQAVLEQLIRPRLDEYRRMLLWMAGLWRERTLRRSVASDDELDHDLFHIRVAMTTAKHLEDPSAVGSDHPFLDGLATLSLLKAMRSLSVGIDLRDPDVRQAVDAGEDLRGGTG
jgi:hypothetical protein